MENYAIANAGYVVSLNEGQLRHYIIMTKQWCGSLTDDKSFAIYVLCSYLYARNAHLNDRRGDNARTGDTSVGTCGTYRMFLSVPSSAVYSQAFGKMFHRVAFNKRSGGNFFFKPTLLALRTRVSEFCAWLTWSHIFKMSRLPLVQSAPTLQKRFEKKSY